MNQRIRAFRHAKQRAASSSDDHRASAARSRILVAQTDPQWGSEADDLFV